MGLRATAWGGALVNGKGGEKLKRNHKSQSWGLWPGVRGVFGHGFLGLELVSLAMGVWVWSRSKRNQRDKE
ncbi:hypothetical protein CFP56_033499 [Quercus suber]|uniref:Uncharacterized protein n=1 Tax=Quercus suber TaxID=58331 RepID=A0AAW0JGJ8_QUESU